MVRYRHWKNWGQGGDTVFFTATVLDFVHAFAQPKCRDLMAASLLSDCVRNEVWLHGFVVMPHHVHSLVTLPEAITASKFVGIVKANSARRIKPLLDPLTERGFDQQRDLNTRQFWMKSFRSVVVSGEAMFRQKLDYIHFNPVKAEYCESEVDYRWSSAWAWNEEGWQAEAGCLDAARLMEVYAPGGLGSTFRIAGRSLNG